MAKVLLLYGTRYGTTKEISDEIEKIIQEKGFETESFNLSDINVKDIPPLDKYNGVILGSGIKINRWTKAAKKFLNKRNSELKSMQNMMGVYVCCGGAAKKSDIKGVIEKYITAKLEDTGLNPSLIDAFGGAYDLREGSAIKGMTRKIVIGIMQKEEGIENPDGKMHDFRDWEQIKAFATKFIEILNQ